MSKKFKKRLKKKEQLAIQQALAKMHLKPRRAADSRAHPMGKPPIASRRKGRYVYFFGDGQVDGQITSAELLGSKGASLAEMTLLGLPVPPGFTITTEVGCWLHQHGNELPRVVDAQIDDALARLETVAKKKFGDSLRPLVLAVRASGAPRVESIFNLGAHVRAGRAPATFRFQLKEAIRNLFARQAQVSGIQAVTVQAMVFGNADAESCAGFCATRHPTTGKKGLTGRYLLRAQGEELRGGQRPAESLVILQEKMPRLYRELLEVGTTLETHYREAQEFPFAIEKGALFILQTRPLESTLAASLRIAVEMVAEKSISWQQALERISARELAAALAQPVTAGAWQRQGCPYLLQAMAWAKSVPSLPVRIALESPREMEEVLVSGARGVTLAGVEILLDPPVARRLRRQLAQLEEGPATEKMLDRWLPLLREKLTAFFQSLRGLPAAIRLTGLDRPFAGNHIDPLYQSILELQARAIFEAIASVRKEGIKAEAELLLPLPHLFSGLGPVAQALRGLAAKVARSQHVSLPFRLGAWIETSRACLAVEEFVPHLDYLCFDASALTQSAFGLSSRQIEGLSPSPFSTLDLVGVGGLIRLAIDLARRVQPNILFSLWGPHGGDPTSIQFCHQLGLAHVSSPLSQIPVARLAAAQAALALKNRDVREGASPLCRVIPAISSIKGCNRTIRPHAQMGRH